MGVFLWKLDYVKVPYGTCSTENKPKWIRYLAPI